MVNNCIRSFAVSAGIGDKSAEKTNRCGSTLAKVSARLRVRRLLKYFGYKTELELELIVFLP